LVYLFPVISTSTWGISIVGAKILSNQGFDPLEIVFFRFFIASFIFIPIIFSSARVKSGFVPEKDTWIPILGLALTGVVINNIIFYSGLARTDASIAALIVAFTPLSTMLFASVMLKEKLTQRKGFSVVLGVLGVSIIFNYSSSGKLWGNLLVLLAIAIWGSSFSFSKIMSEKGLSSIAITGWSQIIGTIILVPFIIQNNSIQRYLNLNREALFWFLFMGFIASAISYILYYQAIAELGAGKVAPTTNIIPFSGYYAAWILLNDTIRIDALIGAILVICGVIIVQQETVE
jgi:drug/metabolite transporter (DMT)-like permease